MDLAVALCMAGARRPSPAYGVDCRSSPLCVTAPHPAPRTFVLVSEPTGWPNGSSFLVSVLVPPRLNFQEQLSKSARLDIQSGARRQAPFRLGSPNLYDRLPWISLSLSFGAGAPQKLVILPTAQSFST